MDKRHAYYCYQEVVRDTIHLYSVCYQVADNVDEIKKEFIDMYYKINKKEFIVVRNYIKFFKGKKTFEEKFNNYVSKEKAFTYIRNIKRRLKEDAECLNAEFNILWEETKG